MSGDANGWQPIENVPPAERMTVLGYGSYRNSPHGRTGKPKFVAIMDWVDWIGGWSVSSLPFEPTHWGALVAYRANTVKQFFAQSANYAIANLL